WPILVNNTCRYSHQLSRQLRHGNERQFQLSNGSLSKRRRSLCPLMAVPAHNRDDDPVFILYFTVNHDRSQLDLPKFLSHDSTRDKSFLASANVEFPASIQLVAT